jgi:hypothetical protein
MPESPIPTDHFSRRLRELTDNPGAIRASSTIQTQDFYGNAESWIVDTFRQDGAETVFLQRISADPQPIRIVLPPDVTDAISRQRDRCVTVARRRGARTAVATKRAAGIDPAAALKKHRAAKRRKA